MRLPNRNDARNQADSEASSPACTWKPRSRGSSSRRTSVLGHRDPLGLADRLAVFVEERGAAVLAQAPAKDADPDLEQNSGQGDMRTADRSEERRVGKECRWRWAPEHEKKKKTARVGASVRDK